MWKKINYKRLVAALALVAVGAVSGNLGLVSMGIVDTTAELIAPGAATLEDQAARDKEAQ